MKKEKIINPQSYAYPFEIIMRNVFGCDRGGVGGLVDASFVRSNPKAATMSTLMYVYRLADNEKRKEIQELLEDINFHFQFNFDTLLSFEENTKVIDDCTYELSYLNGQIAIESIEEKFRKICIG